MINRTSILLLAGLVASACSQRQDSSSIGNGSASTPASTPSPAIITEGAIKNSGFEVGVMEPWTTNVHADPDAYHFDMVSDTVGSGHHALRIQSNGSEPWGGIMQYLVRPGLAGKRVVLSASVKADNVPGGVQMLAVFRGTTALPFEHDFTDLGASFDWQRIEQEFDVPANTTDIEIGLMQLGSGTLWVDDITLVEK